MHPLSGQTQPLRYSMKFQHLDPKVKVLLPSAERSQLRSLGNLIRMPPVHIHWRWYIFYLAWEHLGFPQEEPNNVAGERDVWTTMLNL